MKQTVLKVEFIRVNGIYLYLENENITVEVEINKRGVLGLFTCNIESFLFANLGNLNQENFLEISRIYHILENIDNNIHLEVYFTNGSRYELSNKRWKESL